MAAFHPPESTTDLLHNRYYQKGEDWEGLCRRVAHTAAQVEPKSKRAEWEGKFFELLHSAEGLPNTPALVNLGANHAGSVAACFSFRPDDHMTSIMEVSRLAAMTLKFGGGAGFELSLLRPAGSAVQSTHKQAMGPVGVMKFYNSVGDMITQAGIRKAALIAILRIDHPDVIHFMQAKSEDKQLANFNISVSITDGFMKKLSSTPERPHIARFGGKQYYILTDGTAVLKAERGSKEVLSVEDTWNLLCEGGSLNGDPGIYFVDHANKNNPLLETPGDTESPYYLHGTNPCVTGDTRLHTHLGLVKAKDLCQRGDTLEVTVDKRALDLQEKGTEKRPALPMVMTTKAAHIFRLRTKEGYNIKASPWHEFYTTRGKLRLEEVEVGDKILIQSGEGIFGPAGTKELGTIIGLIAGDGCISDRGKGKHAAEIDLWGKDKPLAERLVRWVNNLIAGLSHNGREYKVSAVRPKGTDKVVIRSTILARVLADYWFTKETKYDVPEVIWSGTRPCVVGYLRGLFSADGTVNASSGGNSCSIRLSSSKPLLLEQVQILLSNFGIFSRIYKRREAGERMLPDGKGGKKVYQCNADYELIIDGESRGIFMEKVGFLQDYKNSRYTEWAKGKLLRKTQQFTAEVSSFEYMGTEEVYDTTQEDHNTVIFNGFVTGQCGELPLEANGACVLGCVDLAKFVVEEELDTERLATIFRTMCRLLENMTDISEWPDEVIKETVLRTRRIGVGVMGFASMLDKLGIMYGSDECIKMIDIVGSLRETACAEESKQLAKERGSYPASINGEKHRNVARTVIAPTGTRAMIANTSWGIEPHLYWAFEERRNDQKRFRFLPAVHEYLDEDTLADLKEKADGNLEHLNNMIQSQLPLHMTTARDLSPDAHLRVVAQWQRYTDSAVSKCLSEGTLVHTNKGILPIEQLGGAFTPDKVAKPLEGLKVIDKDGIPRKVTAHYCAGKLPTRRIRLSNGSTLSGARETHRVLTPSGWKRLKDLRVGEAVFVRDRHLSLGSLGKKPIDSVEISRNCKPITIPEEMSVDLACWLGMVAADGYVITKTGSSWVQLTEKNPKVGKRFDTLTQKIFGRTPKVKVDGRNGVILHTIHSTPLAHWTEALIGDSARTKHAPKQILHGSKEEKISFAEGLTLDGYVLPQGSGGLVIYGGISKRLRDETAEILRSLGLPQVRKREKKVHGRNYNCYIVEVREDLQELIDPIEKHKSVSPSRKRSLVGIDPSAVENLKISCLDPRYRGWLSLRARKRDYCWSTTARSLELQVLGRVEKVTLIEDPRETQMFDIQVEGNHSYLIDGIVSHNTIVAPFEVLTPEKVSEIYRFAWESKLKGLTVYPEGSRQGEPMSIGRKKKTHAGRPKKLPSETYEEEVMIGRDLVQAFCFVGLNPKNLKEPVEVFLKHPHVEDPTAIQFIDVLTRMISLALRHRRCPSCGEEAVPLGEIIKQLRKTDGQSLYSVPGIFVKALGEYLGPGESVGKCPDHKCKGELTIIEGCQVCMSCKWRACG